MYIFGGAALDNIMGDLAQKKALVSQNKEWQFLEPVPWDQIDLPEIKSTAPWDQKPLPEMELNAG